MVKFINAKFDFDKKVTFSFARVLFLTIVLFSLGAAIGIAWYSSQHKPAKPITLNIPVAPAPAISLSPVIDNVPGSSEKIPLEIITDIVSDNGACLDKKNITSEDYNMDFQAVDLNNDKIKEIIIDAFSLCEMDFTASNYPENHPVYVYQGINGAWTKILEGGGSSVDILDTKTDDYNDLSIGGLLSRVLITTSQTFYKWNKSKLSYEEISSITESENNTESNDNSIDNWNSYINYKHNFEFKYSSKLRSTVAGETVIFSSAPMSCKTDQSGEKKVEVNDFKITFTPRSGASYNQIWKDSFVLDFNRSSYDGVKTIGGKTAYYFFQGAEMEMSRAAYLVKKTSTTALEINVYKLEYGMVTDCDPPLSGAGNQLTDLDKQIFSTLKFSN